LILTEIRRECGLEGAEMTATSANARTFLSYLKGKSESKTKIETTS